MASLEELDDMERQNKDDGEEKKDGDDGDKDSKKPSANGTSGSGGDAEMKDADKPEEEEDALDAEILHSSTRDIINRRKLLENEMRIMKSEFGRLSHEKNAMNEKIKDNVEKIDNNRYVSDMRCVSRARLFAAIHKAHTPI